MATAASVIGAGRLPAREIVLVVGLKRRIAALVICPLHLGLIRGAPAELGTGVEADWLEPFAEPGACVGHLTGA